MQERGERKGGGTIEVTRLVTKLVEKQPWSMNRRVAGQGLVKACG